MKVIQFSTFIYDNQVNYITLQVQITDSKHKLML